MNYTHVHLYENNFGCQKIFECALSKDQVYIDLQIMPLKDWTDEPRERQVRKRDP